MARVILQTIGRGYIKRIPSLIQRVSFLSYRPIVCLQEREDTLTISMANFEVE